MHIVHILKGKANPETLNGVNKVVHWMATVQTSLGHDVEVWGITKSVNRQRKDAFNYKLRLMPQLPFRAIVAKEIKKAIAELDRDAYVHFHCVFAPEFPGIARILNKRGIPYGITPHGAYSPGVMNKNRFLKRLYMALRERRYVAGASWVQATGCGEVNDIYAIAPRVKAVLIPNGQERDLLAGIEVPQMTSERPVIGYCGRLSILQKGLDYLVNGFSAYKSSGGRGQLWLIGDDVDRPTVEHMVAEGGVNNDVRFFGTMSGVEKLKIIANFDVFIHSSRWEGLPMACLEAASLGKPLLVSQETNLAEYVEQSRAGLVLDETSAAGVARALERVDRLYENNQLLQMSKNALMLVEKEFSWDENASKFIAVAEEQIKSQSQVSR
jgi:glycosyltransferase involved in cell wall biosynthesis